jgi:hypothetical protein
LQSAIGNPKSANYQMSRHYTLQRAPVFPNRGIHVDYAVKFNIPEAEAVDRLKDLIREHGKWVDSAQQAAVLDPAL